VSNVSGNHDDPTYFDPVPFHAQRISAAGELLWSDTLVSAGRKWQVVPDGMGGAVFAWDDYETYSKGLHDDYLRLQRIAPNGTRPWGDDGRLIVASSPFREVTPEETASGVKGIATRSRPTYEGIHYVVTDGAGGVIILWEEDTGGEDNRVYAQRIDREGNYVWPDKVTTAATDLLSAESDGEGGVKIGTPFYTDRNTGTVRVYAHISGDGEVLPTSEWVSGVTKTFSDGLGGSFHIEVEEYTTYPPREWRLILYIQRLDGAGKTLWARQVFSEESPPNSPVKYLADGKGGIIITYNLQNDSVPRRVMALRLDADGSPSWGEEGIPVFNLPNINYQSIVATFSDGSGRIIVLAVLGKGGLSGDMVYGQRLNINGNRLWGGGIRIDR